MGRMSRTETIECWELLKYRAMYQITLMFPGLNRFELLTLLQISAYLRLQGKTITGLKGFCDCLSGNAKARHKSFGAVQGLLKGKYLGLYEYIPKPGSRSIGISELGLKVIESFYAEFNRLNKQTNKVLGKEKRRAKINKHSPKILDIAA